MKYNNEVIYRAGYRRQITGRVSSETKCHIGPRGNKTSVFDVYFRDKKTQEPVRIFTYEGMEDLDYSVFTEKCIYFFEGKNFPGGRGELDLGWHKIAFPAGRFRKYSDRSLIPAYFLNLGAVVYFFVFPDFQFYRCGVVLNDERGVRPEHVFKIGLGRREMGEKCTGGGRFERFMGK